MKIIAAICMTLALSATLAAQNQQGSATEQSKPSNPCLIVKHKGTVGRRLMWTALIGVPIAPGAKFDYVDSVNYSPGKMSYSGKDLQTMQGAGVHVVVLDNKSSASDRESARKSCQ